MRVTEIKKIGKGNRYYVAFDDERKVTIEAEILAKSKLKTDDEIDEERLKQILLENGDFAAFDRALTYLERNIKTQKGIRQFLKDKGFLEESIDKAVEKLIDYGYIDDGVFAENYIKTYANKKGRKLLKYELVSKGVSGELAEQKIEELLSSQDEFDSCQEILKKYIKNKPIDQKLRQKSYAYLAGKGFSLSVINKALKELICEQE